jgi:DNA-binding CsgD family transcriptional regulator
MHDDLTLTALSRIAGLGTAVGPVEPLVRQILAELAVVVGYRAAVVCELAHASGTRRIVAASNGSAELRAHAMDVELTAVGTDGWPAVTRLDELGYPVSVLSLLTTRDDRRVGLLLLAGDEHMLTDSAQAVVGHSAPVLAAMLDPVRAAAGLAAAFADGGSAVAVLGDGQAIALQGSTREDLLDAESPLRRAAAHAVAGDRSDAAFLWAGSGRPWLSCRVFRCHGGVSLITLCEPRNLHCLTRRELEVLSHLAEGASNAEIAARLWVTPRTVRAHVEQIMLKLGASSRTGAVARALDEGLRLAS